MWQRPFYSTHADLQKKKKESAHFVLKVMYHSICSLLKSPSLFFSRELVAWCHLSLPLRMLSGDVAQQHRIMMLFTCATFSSLYFSFLCIQGSHDSSSSTTLTPDILLMLELVSFHFPSSHGSYTYHLFVMVRTNDHFIAGPHSIFTLNDVIIEGRRGVAVVGTVAS